MADNKRLIDMLIRHEGLELKPYRDIVGKLTIAIGRNLDDRGITREEALFMVNTDIAIARVEIRKHVPGFDLLTDARKDALIDMFINLGDSRFAGFRKMLAALNRKEYDTAAAEMLDSKWADQVGVRAKELAAMIRTGSY